MFGGAMVSGFALLGWLAGAHATQVTIDNFLIAESDHYMDKYVKLGGFGKFLHTRTVTPVNTSAASAPTHGQTVIRMNRDTLYSMMVLDTTSALTITFPDVGKRFLSLQFVSESHDVFRSAYTPGKYLLTHNGCDCEPPCQNMRQDPACVAYGTKYAIVILRTLADAESPSDVAEAHKAQDAFGVEQAQTGKWNVPDWNQTELATIRNHLLDLKRTSTEPTTFGFFTGPEKIDHLFGALNVAAGWGGTRPEDQTYTFWSPTSSAESYSLRMPPVPVEGNGFWSITVYNKEGFMFAEPSNYNSAARGPQGLNPDGSTTVFFGGCDDPGRQKPSKAHCLPTQPGWSMVVRYFRPSKAILDGSWKPAYPAPDHQSGHTAEL